MLNQVILVGEIEGLTDTSVLLIVEETENAKAQILRVELSEQHAKALKEYASRGDILFVKAHLENSYPTVRIVAEELTYMAAQ